MIRKLKYKDIDFAKYQECIKNSEQRKYSAEKHFLDVVAGFKLNQVQLVNGEKDWVYGVKYQGRQLAAGEKIPVGSSLTLMVGNGSGDTSEEDSADVSVDTDQPVTSESSSTQDDSWF
jgi:hypothetical protein